MCGCFALDEGAVDIPIYIKRNDDIIQVQMESLLALFSCDSGT
jgi:hypothetical protein